MNDQHATLIIGAGPAALQLSLDLATHGRKVIGLYNRPGPKGDRLKRYLQDTPRLTLSGKGKASHVQGTATIACYLDDIAALAGDWAHLVLAVPAHHYHTLLQEIDWARLPAVRSVTLLSASIGSGMMAQGILHDRGRDDIEILSLSTYYATTKYVSPDQPWHAFTSAFKQTVYIANQHGDSTREATADLIRMLGRHNITTVMCGSLLEAEKYSITNYVHPPFALAQTTLTALFDPQSRWQYLYKVQPEGPICPAVIADMCALAQDYKVLLNALGATEINLLRFLNDDNYPVPESMVSRHWIENFTALSPLEQHYALFVRYTALLVDPLSTPDEKGRYYDFSAVKVESVYRDNAGLWRLPRIPLEDVDKLRVLVTLAALLNITLPTASRLLDTYDHALDAFINKVGAKNCHASMRTDQDKIAQQAALIYQQWKKTHE